MTPEELDAAHPADDCEVHPEIANEVSHIEMRNGNRYFIPKALVADAIDFLESESNSGFF